MTPSNWTWQNEALYCDLLQFALRLCPEILCVDLRLDDERITKLVQSKGSSKIMGHYYDPDPGPNGWCGQSRQRILRRAEELGCDIVRLCQPAKSANDNVSVQQIRAAREERGRSRVPLIAYNTGELGRMSCCFNPILTPVTHPVLRTYSSTASSSDHHLLTVAEAQNALFSSFVLDRMHFGIIGADIAWSLSPTMHNAAFKLLGMPHEYTLIQRSSLDDLDALAHDPHFGGASITMPFKQDIIPFLDTLSPEAQAIGAVNTLVPVRLAASGATLGRNRAGPVHALHGENTDWKGIVTCIRRSLSPINAVKPLSTALVLGAGGMARAAIFALLRLGVRNIFVYNRTREHAEAMARHFQRQTLATESGKQVNVQLGHGSDEAMAVDPETADSVHCSLHILPSLGPWPEGFQPPSIIVSCVPGVAETGASTDLTVPPDWLGSHNGGVLVELAYDTLETPLAKQARERSRQGWIVVDALQTLPEQAIWQFELFTGRKAPRKLMRTEVFKRYKGTVG
ncbi:quinate pathway repressor protein [Lasiodiplodia theobromae]|uniref:Quinate repressor protein n=2 Tax=Lasiodiplodia theobromae TaxID=45133 RepID=A0A5N5DCA6_9PEZI|nr:Quinate repressor protein [Lasiodiplodia theobromae]KAF9632972.1 quinate pathway repressor protein [Lasiodiplodia theobromae]